MKWVSVEDELPDHGENVLVTYVDEEGYIEPEIDYLESCVDTGVDYWANSGDLVTHWCEIPEPPSYYPIQPDKYTTEAIKKLEEKFNGE